MFGRKQKPQVRTVKEAPIFHIPTDYRKSAGDGQPKADVIPLPRKANAIVRIGMLATGAMAAMGSITIR